MPTKKILLVDDDPDVRLAMHVRLKANGYDTCFASDALSSVTEARKQHRT
jgi:CheY-like chemotaxis protein